MGGVVNTPPPSPADEEHPLVAALSIFVPGMTGAPGSAERPPENDADSIPYDAVVRRLARPGSA